MRLKYWLFTSSFIVIVVLIVCLMATNNKIININNLLQSNNTSNSANKSNSSDNLNINSTSVVDPFYIPPNNYVINNINWSKYPNLQKGYVLTAYNTGPNDVLNYDFVDVQICTEIKDTDNETLIEEQLSGVAKEAKIFYGSACGITIAGTRGGAEEYMVSIFPYNDTVML